MATLLIAYAAIALPVFAADTPADQIQTDNDLKEDWKYLHPKHAPESQTPARPQQMTSLSAEELQARENARRFHEQELRVQDEIARIRQNTFSHPDGAGNMTGTILDEQEVKNHAKHQPLVRVEERYAMVVHQPVKAVAHPTPPAVHVRAIK